MKKVFALLSCLPLIAAAAPVSDFGTNAALQYQSHDKPYIDPLMQKLASIECRFVRVGLMWHWVQPKQGEFHFGFYDDLFARMEKAGVTPLVILDNLNKKRQPYRDIELYREFVRETAKHFKGKVRYYEIHNEINVPYFWGAPVSAKDYIEVLKIAYTEIKKADPEAVVIASGLSQVPIPLLEEMFQLGALAYTDAVNIHPYSWREMPEYRQVPRLEALKELLKKYHAENKPVWVTETGWSTGANVIEPAPAIIRSGLKLCKIDPKTSTLGVILDDENTYYSNQQMPDLQQEFFAVKALTLKELRTVEVKEVPVVLLCPGGAFPNAHFDAVRDYVKRGGTLIWTSGRALPFYYTSTPGGHSADFKQVNDLYSKELHLGWEAPWKNKALPKKFEFIRLENATERMKIRGDFRHGWCLSDKLLKPGDRLLPLAYSSAAKEGKEYVTSGVFLLNSDLKGKLIISTEEITWDECVSEADQAKLLVRNYLVLRGCGAAKVFNFTLRDRGFGDRREEHFGILKGDLSGKPAWQAVKTMLQFCPAGSRDFTYSRSGLLCQAAWTTPQGARTFALWSSGKCPVPVSIKAEGTVRAFDDMGKELPFTPAKMTLTDGVIYLTGVSKLELSPALTGGRP